MNGLDIAILLLFIPGIVRGLSKGFLEQAISLGGVLASVWLAFKFSGFACEKLKEYITVSDTVLSVIGFAVVLLLGILATLLVAKLITKVVEMASLGWLNKVLGLVFALATTALIVSTLIILFDTLNLKFNLTQSPVLENSVLYGWLKSFGYFVFPYLKQLLMINS